MWTVCQSYMIADSSIHTNLLPQWICIHVTKSHYLHLCFWERTVGHKRSLSGKGEHAWGCLGVLLAHTSRLCHCRDKTPYILLILCSCYSVACFAVMALGKYCLRYASTESIQQALEGSTWQALPSVASRQTVIRLSVCDNLEGLTQWLKM